MRMTTFSKFELHELVIINGSTYEVKEIAYSKKSSMYTMYLEEI